MFLQLPEVNKEKPARSYASRRGWTEFFLDYLSVPFPRVNHPLKMGQIVPKRRFQNNLRRVITQKTEELRKT
jgi:hypothetical protein